MGHYYFDSVSHPSKNLKGSSIALPKPTEQYNQQHQSTLDNVKILHQNQMCLNPKNYNAPIYFYFKLMLKLTLQGFVTFLLLSYFEDKLSESITALPSKSTHNFLLFLSRVNNSKDTTVCILNDCAIITSHKTILTLLFFEDQRVSWLVLVLISTLSHIKTDGMIIILQLNYQICQKLVFLGD